MQFSIIFNWKNVPGRWGYTEAGENEANRFVRKSFIYDLKKETTKQSIIYSLKEQNIPERSSDVWFYLKYGPWEMFEDTTSCRMLWKNMLFHKCKWTFWTLSVSINLVNVVCQNTLYCFIINIAICKCTMVAVLLFGCTYFSNVFLNNRNHSIMKKQRLIIIREEKGQ